MARFDTEQTLRYSPSKQMFTLGGRIVVEQVLERRDARRDTGDANSVLGRLGAIMDAFDAETPDLSLSELVTRTQLSKSTTYRLAERLASMGWLQRTGTRYRLGIRLFELGGLVQNRDRVRETALPFMEDLYEATHEVVHLGVLDGTDVLYIDKIAGHRRVTVPTRIGGRMPTHCTGLGKALLSRTSPEELIRMFPRGLRPATPYTIASVPQLAEHLAEVRRLGYAVEREEARLGCSCVSAPIIVDRRVVAAVSVCGPSSRIDPERLASLLKKAASGINAALASARW